MGLIIGKEVESGEGSPFGLQVVFQLLLDVLQALIGILEFDQKSIGATAVNDQGLLLGLSHVVSPELISQLELLGFVRELLLDVLGVEDVLQVHPLALEGEPLVQHVRDVAQLLLPLLHLVADLIHVL